MQPPTDAPALARRLTDAGYTLDAVTDRIGAPATAALARNTTLATREALAGARDAQATLIRAFLLQDAVAAADLEVALGDLTPFVAAGLLDARRSEHDGLGRREEIRDGIRAAVEIRPYAAAGVRGETVAPGGGSGPGGAVDGWVMHDRIPTLDGRIGVSRPDFVLGLSPASTALAQMTIRDGVGRALDLGTGCGVQSLHLAGHADQVVATDLNPRALTLAAWTAGLNGIEVDLREGSLFEPVASETFDLIVTNPPFVMSPPGGERLVYREGTLPSDDLMRRVVTEGGQRLAPGGVLQVLGNWAITEDADWTDRLRAWIEPTGCDALVLERERLDPYAYIEVWLADAGLVGTPEYAARYEAWLAYFRALGIAEVGMGWIALYRPGSGTGSMDQPQLRDAGRPEDRPGDFRGEVRPHAVHQPVGEAFGAYPEGLALARVSDDVLAALPLKLDPRVDAETIGCPGAADPEHLVFRQRYGFGRALEADTALAAVLGACDGELPLGVLIGAVADLLGVDDAALALEVLPTIRNLAREGYVVAPRGEDQFSGLSPRVT